MYNHNLQTGENMLSYAPLQVGVIYTNWIEVVSTAQIRM